MLFVATGRCRSPTLPALLLLVFAACPAQAAEREFEGDSPPGSVQDISTPLGRVFPSIARKDPLFRRLSKTLKSLPPFLAGTEMGVRYRTFYKRDEQTDGDLSEAWAMGGSVYYRSGWLGDALRVELEGFTSQPIVARRKRGGTLLLKPVQNDYSALGIANAQLRYKGYRLTGYRQYLELPYLNRRDSRMTPNTFEALTFEKYEGDVRFSLGHTWRIKQRNSEEFETLSRSVGLRQKRGVTHAGVLWIPNEKLQIGTLVGHQRDVTTGLYNEMNWIHPIREGLDVRLDTQLTYQWDVGNDLLDDALEETWNLGIRGALGVHGAIFRLGFVITGPDGSIRSLYGTSPSYVDLQKLPFNRPDEKVLLLSASYDFAGIGVEGLRAITNFAAGFDGKVETRRGDRQELDLTVDYRLQGRWFENLWLRFRGAWVHDGDANREGTDIQLIVRYEFPVI